MGNTHTGTDLFDGTDDAYDPLAAIDGMLESIIPERDTLRLLSDIQDVRRAAVCLRDGRLGKNMAGLGALWGYFPHALEVKVNGVSIADKLSDPKQRASIARKTLAFVTKHEKGRVSYNRVRQSVKAYCGHHVSNFRPVAARDLFVEYGNRGVIFDPCGGWGGRMVGAIAAGCERYVCYDASCKTAAGLRDVAEDANATNCIARFGAVEDADLPDGFADMAFTSPPYFDAERYSLDPEQSWVRYQSYGAWRDGFLVALCRQMTKAVRGGGIIALNIADVKKSPLVSDARTILASLGLAALPDVQYILSSIAGKGEKAEPVLMFRKPLDTRRAVEYT